MKDDISLKTIGCDLGDKISELCRLRSDGSQERATVRKLGHQVTVANPRQVKLISGGTNKSDRGETASSWHGWGAWTCSS